jgi:hypothetical protein
MRGYLEGFEAVRNITISAAVEQMERIEVMGDRPVCL